MKKYLFLSCVFSLVLVSCSGELDLENKEYVSREAIEDLAQTSPEALLVVTNGVNDGSNAFLRSFSTYGGGAHSDFGLKAFDMGLDLMSNDVVQVRSHWFSEYYNYLGREQQNVRSTATIWNFYYKVIRDANLIIELTPADTEDPGLRYTLGKALALRGFSYFNLIRLYANGEVGIPLYTETEFIPARAATSQVVAQIGDDLERGFAALEGYSRSDATQIDQTVVAGLLARYYLEYGDYSQAIANAEIAQSGGPIMSMTQIFDGFDEISNPSWLWGADITPETSSTYASFFSQFANANPGYAGLLGVYKNVDRRLFDKIEDTDARKEWFISEKNTGEFPALPKYANVKFIDDTFFEGDYVYMRVEEFYLVEAEARALSGDDEGAAQALFELVSQRDSAYTLSTKTGADLLEEIRTQRRIELWGEGFAFYDMKRWDKGLNRIYEGSNHAAFGLFDFPADSNKFIFQIPISEINANDAINEGDQNPF